MIAQNMEKANYSYEDVFVRKIIQNRKYLSVFVSGDRMRCNNFLFPLGQNLNVKVKVRHRILRFFVCHIRLQVPRVTSLMGKNL